MLWNYWDFLCSYEDSLLLDKTLVTYIKLKGEGRISYATYQDHQSCSKRMSEMAPSLVVRISVRGFYIFIYLFIYLFIFEKVHLHNLDIYN